MEEDGGIAAVIWFGLTTNSGVFQGRKYLLEQYIEIYGEKDYLFSP